MDTDKIRLDFPILQQDITYLDSACSSLKPLPVIEAITEYYKEYPSCGGRSLHKLGKRVTEEVSESRKEVKNLINAKKEEEIIFTKNTTEAINLIAKSFKFKKNDIILASDKEHDSNLLPWLQNNDIKYIPLDSKKNHTFDLKEFKEKVKNAKLVSITYSSSIDGYTFPVEDIIKIAHENEALVLLDAAQTAPRKEINVKRLEADFLAFSGYKMLGPSGIGILYGKLDYLERLNPFMLGGKTVKNSYHNKFELESSPKKFEAGLQNYAGIIGLRAAIHYLKRIGLYRIEEYESKLTRLLLDELKKIKNITIVGYKGAEQRAGIVSFNVKNMNPHDAALFLNDSYSIMVRSGTHCTDSWFNKYKINGCIRASLYFYNTQDEVIKLVEALKKIVDLS